MAGIRVSETTVGRMVAERGIWTSRAQRRRLRAIKRRLATWPPGEEAFYEDDGHGGPDQLTCHGEMSTAMLQDRDALPVSTSGTPALAAYPEGVDRLLRANAGTTMIDRREEGIAAYCPPENKVAFAFIEWLNNKARGLQRRAHGLRDEAYLLLKIVTCILPAL